MCEGAHVGAFVTQMIEIQKVDVRLATIDARVISQILPDPRPQVNSVLIPTDSCIRDLLLSIPVVPSVGVLALTQQADPLTGLPLERAKRKLRQRLCLCADSADTKT
jgi:hypothetical protein